MNHYEEMRYHEREHQRYLANHRYDVVSLGEELSCAKGLERADAEKEAKQEPTPTTPPAPSADEQ